MRMYTAGRLYSTKSFLPDRKSDMAAPPMLGYPPDAALPNRPPDRRRGLSCVWRPGLIYLCRFRGSYVSAYSIWHIGYRPI